MITGKQLVYIKDMYEFVDNNSISIDSDIQDLYDRALDKTISNTEIQDLITMLKDESKNL